VVVLHDINLAARYADNLAVLRNGELFAYGPAQQILTPQLFADVYGVQARVELCSQQTIQVLVDHAMPGM